MYIFTITVYFVIGVTFLIRYYHKNGFTPVSIFLTMQIIMFFGISQIVDFNLQVDRQFIYIYLLTLILFIYGVKFADMKNIKLKRDYAIVKDNKLNKSQRLCVISLIILSIAICYWFFVQTGGNVFILMLNSYLKNNASDFTEQRMSTYSVIGSGYVYQFRVIILPILVGYLISGENRKMKKLGIALLPIMLIFILGTGQRGGFVIFILMWGIALVNLHKYYDLKVKKNIVIVGVAFLALFAFTTFYNGRSAESGSILDAMKQRIISDNQVSAVIAFRYIDSLPTQYGKDWMNMFADLLPGKNDYLTMSNQVFGIIYGNTRGTAPPCIWGSVYYNWGYFGVLLIPIILGFFYQNYFYMFIKKPKTKFNVFMYSAISVSLGTWLFDAPISLFNDGFVTLVILQSIINLCGSKREKRIFVNQRMDGRNSQ